MWEASSFTYIEGSPNGWGQGHWGQWLEGDLGDIRLDENGNFGFQRNIRDFFVRNKIRDTEPRPHGFVTGKKWSDFFRWEIPESINIVVIDPDGGFWFNDNPGEYGSRNRTASKIACYPFPVGSSEERSQIINFIENVVPNDHTIVFYTAIRNTNYDLNIAEWAADSLLLGGRNLFNLLESYGGQLVRDLEDEMRPYIFAFKKNGVIVGEQIADDILGEVNMEVDLEALWYEGSYTSAIVGPARKWERLEWNYSLPTDADSMRLTILGVDSLAREIILLEDFESRDTSMEFIDANRFSYLKLRFEAVDRVNSSCPPLFNWKVFYTGLPDVALDPSRGLANKDTLQIGEGIRWTSGLENLSDYSVDSLNVNFILTKPSGEQEVFESRIGALSANDRTSIELVINESHTIEGENQLLVEVNPQGMPQESEYSNNILSDKFYVLGDRLAPVLDVTFDGIHILDGDLVASRPEIVMTLEDESQYLLLEDTSLFKVEYKTEQGAIERVWFSNLEFLPATSVNDNKAQIFWRPEFLDDGIYELMVRSNDVSGNLSGRLDYAISFEVINQRMISNVMNYPNPFSQSTRFVYTLTGDSPPEQYLLRIMTIAGRVVREINFEELGPLLIGTHLTEFAWDGRDDYGDQLANGVYLYQFIIRDIDGQEYEKLENGTEKFFRKEIGKMVLLR